MPTLKRSWAIARDLIRHEGGNAMLLFAAAMLPLLGLIGSGLDLSRAYLVRSKLQTACDASSLAARRYMAAGVLTNEAKAEGERFFNFNFPQGTMGASPVALTIQPNTTDVSTVDVKARTSVPTSLMSLFGVNQLPVSVECSADQDFINNDIMLVLDVTGSMNCQAGTNCSSAATEQNNSRISRTRTATLALYNALKDANGVRTRYGFMPYSMTVNVGADLNRAWLRDPGNYWQRSNNNWALTPVRHNESWFQFSWTGCVEERSAISQGTGASIRISTDVSQEDIDRTGTNPHLQWTPYDPAATSNVTNSFCPAPALRLTEYNSEGAFRSAANASLAQVSGQTNHDLGMTWGMRYLSSTGMFAADNPTTFRQVPVAKHIIFLTDGEMTASTAAGLYNSYGMPAREVRMTGSGNLVQRHQARFLNACNRARQMGATIWVIVLDDQGFADDVAPCASGSDRVYISNGADLDEVFQRIGKGIGRLRLTQ